MRSSGTRRRVRTQRILRSTYLYMYSCVARYADRSNSSGPVVADKYGAFGRPGTGRRGDGCQIFTSSAELRSLR